MEHNCKRMSVSLLTLQWRALSDCVCVLSLSLSLSLWCAVWNACVLGCEVGDCVC